MAAAAAPAVPVLGFGMGATGDVRAEDVRLRGGGAVFTIAHPGGRERCALRLAGRFNVYNALGAFCTGILLGLDPAEVAAALGRVSGVPGRLEPVPGSQPFSVFVDYAHTPDGLENVLRAAREVAAARVLVVFGCGGDRDRTKRPLMGAIATRLADLCWVTSDNPRSEAPEAILHEIEAGAARTAGARYSLVVDRRQAIGEALAAAAPGDVVVIAGKGHEVYQIFADRTIHFDDREEAAAALARLGYR
jgi:UDP-N-acetylmuramoyl-L-alanyl-D-glutamate--2,6-diaminopimelate ligase